MVVVVVVVVVMVMVVTFVFVAQRISSSALLIIAFVFADPVTWSWRRCTFLGSKWILGRRRRRPCRISC